MIKNEEEKVWVRTYTSYRRFALPLLKIRPPFLSTSTSGSSPGPYLADGGGVS
jgi:hypothetical protein